MALSNNYDTVGTLTRASIKGLTAAQKKALFTDGTQWYENGAYLKTQFEMSACGIQRNSLYDWIMSSNKGGLSKLINVRKRQGSPSLIEPFIMGRQRSVLNFDHWDIAAGYAVGSYTAGSTGPLTSTTGGTYVVRLAPMFMTSAELSKDWFLPGHMLYIVNQASGGAAQFGQFEIVDAAVATNLLSVDVLIVGRNPSATAVQADMTTGTYTGVAFVGINNVNDVEAYCRNMANVNPWKHVPFWYQTYRNTRRIDSEYLKVFNQLMRDNKYFAEFQDLPIAERNRQDEYYRQRQFCNAFFFGRAISSNQTYDLWPNLEQITTVSGATVDPGTGGQLIAYRANMIGIRDQLSACSRVTDEANTTVILETFLETDIYNIHRARKSQGRPATEIDIYTDSTTADQFMVKFLAYAKAKIGDIVRLNIEEGSHFGFQWRRFKLYKPAGVYVNIISHEFFDDMVTAFDSSHANQAARGKFLAVLDLGNGGSIYPSVLASNRKVRTVGEINDLSKIDSTFSCVMENPTQQITMSSETVTAVVECPMNSLWVENFTSIALSTD